MLYSMAKLSKCSSCKKQRYVLYTRTGNVYTTNGNRQIENTGLSYCSGCEKIQKETAPFNITTIIKNNLHEAFRKEYNTLFEAMKHNDKELSHAQLKVQLEAIVKRVLV